MLAIVLLAIVLVACSEESGKAPATDGEEVAPGLEGRLVARIESHTAEELESILRRAESTIDSGRGFPDFEPVEFILHGPEAEFFIHRNYERHREIVDLAARLDAFGVIDVKICEQWMAVNGVSRGDLPAFIDTVPFGPRAEEQLLREGYVYF